MDFPAVPRGRSHEPHSAVVVAPRFRSMEPGGPLQSPARRSQAPQGNWPEAMRTAEGAKGFDIVAASCSEPSYGRKCKIKGHYLEGMLDRRPI